MDRRTFLRVASMAGATVGVGCTDDASPADPPPGSDEPTPSPSGEATPAPTTAPADEPLEGPERSVYHVAPGGRDSNPGTSREPLATIHEGLNRARPGDTVRVAPGEYQEDHAPGAPLQTIRDGAPDAPITVTGPEDAVLHPNEAGPALRIKHSHVRLTGLTIDGLLDPDSPDSVESYSRGSLLHVRPPAETDDYLEDIVCAPAAIGKSGRPLMVFERTKHLEVGPLRVVGLAGAEYVVGDKASHVGEIVYLGQPPSTVDREDYPWDELDQTRHVRVHHIDNSAGHPHSELVNTKIGTRDVLVEYCTSTGGSHNAESFPSAEVRFQSYDATVRWCDLRNGRGDGVHIVHHRPWLRDREDPAVTPDQSGTMHSIYGNVIEGFDGRALRISTTPDEQRVICGNETTGPTDGETGAPCPTDLPDGDGIGHLGGDSPWA